MAPLEKERAVSLILSVVTTSATMADNTTKAPVPKISKPDLFVGFRFKFKAFYTQVRLGI
jgi:hypothetical protein